VPAHTVNLGLTYTLEQFTASVQGHYQGSVNRRSSDVATADFARLRPATVAAWLTVDARVSVRVGSVLEVSLQATNLLGTEGFMVKNFDFPFDYRAEPQRILAGVRAMF
jgi:outer membrane receptor protein involved in Fe transport